MQPPSASARPPSRMGPRPPLAPGRPEVGGLASARGAERSRRSAAPRSTTSIPRIEDRVARRGPKARHLGCYPCAPRAPTEPRPMEHRRSGRTRSRSLVMGPTTLLLAALLLSSGGPGLAATAGRPLAQGPAGGIAQQVQADPIGDLAFELDYNLDSIFRFVADEISYEPYPGVLRGALGTLQARAGNSVDKALLLAALLDASLIPYRFARGRLDEAASAQLLDALPISVEAARLLARRPLDAGVEQVASGDAVGGPLPSGPLVALYQKPDAALKAEGQDAPRAGHYPAGRHGQDAPGRARGRGHPTARPGGIAASRRGDRAHVGAGRSSGPSGRIWIPRCRRRSRAAC